MKGGLIMSNKIKVLTNQNGEVVFVGTHAECSRWLIEKYPNHHDTRINSNVPNPVLPGIFKIRTLKKD